MVLSIKKRRALADTMSGRDMSLYNEVRHYNLRDDQVGTRRVEIHASSDASLHENCRYINREETVVLFTCCDTGWMLHAIVACAEQ